jgi:hypothetical protein
MLPHWRSNYSYVLGGRRGLVTMLTRESAVGLTLDGLLHPYFR